MAIVYYDGDCGYCNRAVMFLINRRISTRFQFAQLEGTYGDHLVRIRPDLKNIDTIIVVDGKNTYIKSDAIIHLLKYIDHYKVLSLVLKLIPKFIRDFGYDLFAKNRHRIQFNEACRLPSPEERKYFLD